MVRCFAGVLIPMEPKEKIKRIIDDLKNLPMKCKFVEAENLHLCFSFLGEVEDNEIKKISERIDSVARNYSSIEVKIHGMKMIPSQNYIRVLALDVADNSGTLIRMIKHIHEEIDGDSKPPHLTICRVKSIEDRQKVIKRIEEMQSKEIASFDISSIQLIKSELSRGGPAYTVVHESNLNRD